MVQITLSSFTPATVPTNGWIVRYRIKGTSSAYTTVGPFMASPIVFSTTDAAGTLYEGFIKRECSDISESSEFAWVTPCGCTDVGFAPNADNSQCQKLQTVSPTITNSGFCLAPSTYSQYTQFGTRIYLPGFTNSDIHLAYGTVGGNIYTNVATAVQWANISGNTVDGPMNREGVWIDSDCDGTKDPLTTGVSTTLAFLYNNISGAPKTVYVGLGADNNFTLIVNGVQICTSNTVADSDPFKIFHIFPVIVPAGVSYFNVVGVGDGSTSDSLAMVVYDNTASQIAAATPLDMGLSVLFKSSSLRGTSYDVSTCPVNYSLDTSAGQGNYICRRTTLMACNTAV